MPKMTTQQIIDREDALALELLAMDIAKNKRLAFKIVQLWLEETGCLLIPALLVPPEEKYKYKHRDEKK